jgi:hypothetical protein
MLDVPKRPDFLKTDSQFERDIESSPPMSVAHDEEVIVTARVDN